MITASIVTFHTDQKDLDKLIGCVMRTPIEKLYIIDNSTNDEIREYVNNNTRIHYIHSMNLGYGSGHNIGIKKALKEGAKYHVILNPDIYWEGDIVKEISEFMESHNSVGLVMPKVTYPNGEIQYLCKLLPTPKELLFRRFLPFEKYLSKIDYNYELHWTEYNQIMEIPSLSGCFMFIRTDILRQINGFDERFFMYAEDLDLCRRIGEISKTIYYPNVSIVHNYEKGSYKNKKLLKYHIISVIKYFNKWGWFLDSKRKAKNKQCIEQIKKNKCQNS